MLSGCPDPRVDAWWNGKSGEAYREEKDRCACSNAENFEKCTKISAYPLHFFEGVLYFNNKPF